MTAAIEAIVAALLALALASSTLGQGELAYAVLESRYASPSSRYVDLADGGRVHYRDEGRPDGSALLLVHGFGASSSDWDAWAARLGSRYRLVALDLPGHGLTRTPRGRRERVIDFVEIVDAVARSAGLNRFILVGHSLGGEVAWRYAQLHADRLRGLVLIDAAGWPSRNRGPAQVLASGLASALATSPPVRAALRRLDAGPLVRRGLRAAVFDPSRVTPEMIDRYVDLSRAPGRRDVLLTIERSSEDVATTDRLATIHTPTLVMVGEDDRLIPPADGGRFAEAIAGSTLRVFKNVGHLPMEEDPDASAEALSRFADGLAP